MNRPLILALPLLICLVALAYAERPTEKEDKATHIVTGVVQKVFHRDGGAENQYIIQIRIDEVERGEGYKPKEFIYAYAFQRKADAPLQPSASGHDGIPREGQRIRAAIKRGRGDMEGLYPNWFTVIQ